MSGSTSKEAKRNLRKAFGADIAAALEEQRALVQQAHNSARVLAKQMLELETTVATLRQGRAEDRRQHGAKLDDALERLDALTAKGKDLAGKVERLPSMDVRLCAVEQWAHARAALTRRQRLVSFLRGTCAVPFVASADAHLGAVGGE